MPMRRLTVIARHLSSGDPYANGSSRVVVYGPSTSRVAKVLWAADECGVAVARVAKPLEELKAHPWYYALNPKRTVCSTPEPSTGPPLNAALAAMPRPHQVPTIKDGSLVLNESNSIVHYLFSQYGGLHKKCGPCDDSSLPLRRAPHS